MPPARMRPVLDFAQRAIALDYRIAYAESSGRTPQLVMVIVVSGALLVGFLVRFTNGFNEEHHLLVPFIYVIFTGLAVSAILDLNDPFHGLLRPDTSNYGDLLESILTERGAASRP
jgi:hypothetical protein